MQSTMRTLDALARDLALHAHLAAPAHPEAVAARAPRAGAVHGSAPAADAAPAAGMRQAGSVLAAPQRWTWSMQSTSGSDSRACDESGAADEDTSAVALRRVLQLSPSEAASPQFAHLFAQQPLQKSPHRQSPTAAGGRPAAALHPASSSIPALIAFELGDAPRARAPRAAPRNGDGDGATREHVTATDAMADGAAYQWQRTNDGGQPRNTQDWCAAAHQAAQLQQSSALAATAHRVPLAGAAAAHPAACASRYLRSPSTPPGGAFDGVAAVAALVAGEQQRGTSGAAGGAPAHPVSSYLSRESVALRSPEDSSSSSYGVLGWSSSDATTRGVAAGSGLASEPPAAAAASLDRPVSMMACRESSPGSAPFPALAYRPRPLQSATGQPLVPPSAAQHHLPLLDAGGGAAGFGGTPAGRVPVRILIRP